MTALRLGLAGCGRIAERGYLPAARALDGLEIAALADPEPRRAGRLAASAGGAAAFGSVAEMLAEGAIEALVVATPVAAHGEIAAVAAAAGIPSLVEKPPAPDLEGARRLAALRPAPAIGFSRRFLQGAELAAQIPASGWLELELELRFRRDGWAAHACADEALLDAGIHLIDLASFLSGSTPIAVRGAAVERDRATLELELGRGRARISCATDRRYAERVAVSDRAGRTLAASRSGRLRAGLARLRGGEDPLVGSLRRQLAAFAAAVHGEQTDVLATGEAAVTAMGAVEAARRSAALGGAEVTVETASAVGARGAAR